jgi:ERCC4-type nuclease
MQRLIQYLLSYLPTRLPVGVTEFETWSDSIIELTGPLADRDSMKFALASMVIHRNPNLGYATKRSFVNGLIKSASNQVCSQVFQDIKKRQQEALEAAQAKKQEDTSTPKESSNEQKTAE